MKKVVLSVINDLSTDHRIDKVAGSLMKHGYDVLIVGRKHNYSLPVKRKYQTKRFKFLFNKGFLFYASYNIRLFFFLLFVKADIFISNDLDTLTANFLAAKLRGKKLIYDSHEYFTEVPELINRPRVRAVWTKIEKTFLPKIKYSYTVSPSIAEIYNKKYGLDMKLVRNIPLQDTVKCKDVNARERIIIYQGSLNKGRGLELLIDSMEYIKNAKLIIAGTGDIAGELRNRAENKRYKNQIEFKGRIAFEYLPELTKRAMLGVSIEENLGLNYYYALPNKLFDYIHACVPVIVSDFPEMKNIVEKYNIGEILKERSPEKLAETINSIIDSPEKRTSYMINMKKAKKELNWENEEKNLFELLD